MLYWRDASCCIGGLHVIPLYWRDASCFIEGCIMLYWRNACVYRCIGGMHYVVLEG